MKRATTKAQLRLYLQTAFRFNSFELVSVTAGQSVHVRDLPNFVPVEQYGPGCAPLPNEVGYCNGTRYILGSLRRWHP